MDFDSDYDINSNEPESSNSNKTTEAIQNEEEIEISSDSDQIRPPTPLKKTKYSHKMPGKILPQKTGGMISIAKIFSIVKNVKSDEKNRIKIKLLNSLVGTKTNCDMECTEAYDLFISLPELLNKTKSSEKYHL